jgi:phosphatidylinositol glycan class M
VFTDAANYIYQGLSPYYRDTYRYTPLLAILMQPNIFWFESFGKFLFILFDLICGYLIIKINDTQSNNKDNVVNIMAISFWFYNPITIAISSRGNAESLMAFLVLAFIYFFKIGSLILAGFFYAFSLHFKIYPVSKIYQIIF